MRYGLLTLVLFIAAFKASATPIARNITFGEIREAQESGVDLTPEQATYIQAVIVTANKANMTSHSIHGSGLFCLPLRQRLTTSFVFSIINDEVRSERGWVYADHEPISKIIFDGLRFQYPCANP